ncbi:hypothetical protein F5B22DRAFT_659652 [Xylaria bambusicola]|uniref:uncharacterized protein n=1 Tax=Xylaria bambusicola TaxID=326684 RepID=UPI0020083EAA|nr:uncharacterized protein F5B22DRAFT_659652 [Xylaria bambusicola]KAI0523894.1 hypothetical protein F5B22DRAFT_659652 [Xylaria bambusicola]
MRHIRKGFSRIKGKWKSQRGDSLTASRVSSPQPLENFVGATRSLDIDIRPNANANDSEPSDLAVLVPAATTTSPAATKEISAPTSVPTVDAVSIKTENDVWTAAYNKFAAREEGLAKDYRTHLTTITGTLCWGSDWARSTVEQLQKDRENRQWHFTFLGKDINIRTQAEKLLKVLVWSNGIVKDALSAQPYAALAWSGVSILLPVCKVHRDFTQILIGIQLLGSATTQNEAMFKGFDAITRILIYWQSYQDTFPYQSCSHSSVILRKSLIDLYSYIFEYQALIICHLSSAQLSRAWKALAGGDEWEKKSSDVEERSNHCKGLMDITQREDTQCKSDHYLEQVDRSFEVLQQIIASLNEQREERRNDRQRELLADLAINHEEFKDRNPKKVENTCKWFLEDSSFRSFRESHESSFLWVSAGPGCGKSVLTKSLIDERQFSTTPATSVVCYFFFKDDDEGRNRSANALSAIVHQLCIQDLTGKFTNHALSQHNQCGKKLATNFPKLWDTLLHCANTPNAGEIICVLDALDECRQDDRNELINRLKDLFFQARSSSSFTQRLKFFVTSRPYDTIERLIESFLNSSSLRIDGEEHSVAINQDIDRVIDAKLPELITHFSPRDQRLVSERLKSMNNRTYLWLRLTFYIIENNPSDYYESSDVTTLLDQLPNEHSKAYEKILEQKHTKHTRHIFQLMLAAKESLSEREALCAFEMITENPPVSHSELEEGIHNIDPFKKMVKNSCGLLVDFHDSKLSFIHQTVREFLTGNSEEGGESKWAGTFKLPECHSAMALSCIQYRSLLELNSPTEGHEQNDNTQYSWPFLEYARVFWYTHYLEGFHGQYLLTKARDLYRMRNSIGWLKMWFCGECELEYDLAERTSRDLFMAVALRLKSVVHALLDEKAANDRADHKYYQPALNFACQCGLSDMLEVLLDKPTCDVNLSVGHNSWRPITCALSWGDLQILRLLLDRRGEEIKVTENDVVCAIEHRERGQECMALLCERVGKKLQVTEDIMRKIRLKRDDYQEFMVMLLSGSKEQDHFAEDAIQAITDRREDLCRGTPGAAEMINLLIDKRGELSQFTEDSVMEVVRNTDWKVFLDVLIKLERIQCSQS